MGTDIRYAISDLPADTSPATIADRLQEQFAPLPTGQIDFGFTASTVWLQLPVKSTADKPAQWILALNTRFMNELRVYLRTAGQWQLLLSNSEHSRFAARPLDYRLLAVEFALAPRESADLLIAYRSRGTTYLPISLETPQSFADSRILANTKNGGFYTAAVLMFLYGLFQLMLPGNRIYLHYLAYLAAAALYIFHMDGLSFQYLWPDFPAWNAFASLPLGLTINIMAANFSRRFLETWEIAPRFDLLIRLMIWLSLLLIACGALISERQIKWISFWLTSSGALLYLAAGIYALLRGHRSARFYVVGWVGICIASTLTSVIHSLPGVFPVSLGFDISKAGILFDALMFGMAMADRGNEIRRQRDAAVQREMIALADRARAQSELAAAERGREDALRMARRQNMQFAAASHDIRQPLSSLKLALAGLPERHAGGDARSMVESVEYLDALVSNYLAQSQARAVQADELDVQERFPIQLVLDGVAQMFAAEAADKGLLLRVSPSNMVVHGNPVATVRIVANLVKNAIKHTASGKVLLGCRREVGACAVWVADTGPGMSPEVLATVRGAFVQADTADPGHGLGLHIVASLCQRLGYRFELNSTPAAGTLAKVRLALYQ